MEYKTDKRTKNLTLHDIHIGDWVQVWRDTIKQYYLPMKIISIDDEGTVGLVIGEEQPLLKNIKYIDALPIDVDLLKGFGFKVSIVYQDRDEKYQDVMYASTYIGQIRYTQDGVTYFRTCGYECEYMHELIDYWYRNGIEIKLKWKGIEK